MKLLFIHIEITKREYYSKLLLSYLAAKNGFTVIMGDILNLFRDGSFLRGITHFKDITPAELNFKFFEKLKKNNFFITSIDEEGGIEYKKFDSGKSNSFLKLRYSEDTLNTVDKVFTWGEFDYKSLIENYPNLSNKISNTGNSRFDFARHEMSNFFDELTSKKKDEPILIVSDLGYVMSSKPIWEQFNILRKAYFANNDENSYEFETYENFANKTIFLGKFVKLIRNLLKNFPDQKFLFRPHPTEPSEGWKKIIGEYDNLEISKNYSVAHILNKSKMLIHNSCYSSIEGAILKKPIISFCPEECLEFRKYFTGKIGIQTRNINEVNKYITSLLKGDYEEINENIKTNYDLVKTRINLENKLSSQKIVDTWVEMSKKIDELTFMERFFFNRKIITIKFGFILRQLIKFFLKLLKYPIYEHSKFEEFNKKKIIEELKSIESTGLNKKGGKFVINKFDKNLCKIEFK